MYRLLFDALPVALIGGGFPSEAYAQIRETGRPAMVQQCKKNFDVMDTNGDGAVTKGDFCAGRGPGGGAR